MSNWQAFESAGEILPCENVFLVLFPAEMAHLVTREPNSLITHLFLDTLIDHSSCTAP